jgi:hypothetical protein
MGNHGHRRKSASSKERKESKRKVISTASRVPHRKLPLDPRPIPRRISRRISRRIPRKNLSTVSIERTQKFLHRQGCRAAPLPPSVHVNFGVRCRSGHHHQVRTQLPERARQLRCGVPEQPLITKCAHSSPSACVISGVGCRSSSSSPSAHTASPQPSGTCNSSGVAARPPQLWITMRPDSEKVESSS